MAWPDLASYIFSPSSLSCHHSLSLSVSLCLCAYVHPHHTTHEDLKSTPQEPPALFLETVALTRTWGWRTRHGLLAMDLQRSTVYDPATGLASIQHHTCVFTRMLETDSASSAFEASSLLARGPQNPAFPSLPLRSWCSIPLHLREENAPKYFTERQEKISKDASRGLLRSASLYPLDPFSFLSQAFLAAIDCTTHKISSLSTLPQQALDFQEKT